MNNPKNLFRSQRVEAKSINYGAENKEIGELRCLNPDRALNLLSAREVEFAIRRIISLIFSGDNLYFAETAGGKRFSGLIQIIL